MAAVVESEMKSMKNSGNQQDDKIQNGSSKRVMWLSNAATPTEVSLTRVTVEANGPYEPARAKPGDRTT